MATTGSLLQWHIFLKKNGFVIRAAISGKAYVLSEKKLSLGPP